MIGLGRLGGAELSYASDIDVIFVYDGTTAARLRHRGAHRDTTRAARSATAPRRDARSASTRACVPKATQGPLARSLGGYETYFAQWAQTWEFQALTKARFVAGDVELGERFVELAHSFVVPRPVSRRSGDARCGG